MIQAGQIHHHGSDMQGDSSFRWPLHPNTKKK